MTMKKQKTRTRLGRPPSIKDPYHTICAAAARLFAERGFENTSLQDVAAAVGVTKAGLYHYFPTKHALFDAIVMGTLQQLQDGALAATGKQASARERLVGFMTAHANYFKEHGDNYRASFFSHGGGDLSSFSEEQLAARKAYVQILEGVLETGMRSGEFGDLEVPITARGILGMLNWMARWYQPDGRLSPSQIAQSYARTILAGIAAP